MLPRQFVIEVQAPSRHLENRLEQALRSAVEIVGSSLDQEHPVTLNDFWRLALALEKTRVEWRAGWPIDRLAEPFLP